MTREQFDDLIDYIDARFDEARQTTGFDRLMKRRESDDALAVLKTSGIIDDGRQEK